MAQTGGFYHFIELRLIELQAKSNVFLDSPWENEGFLLNIANPSVYFQLSLNLFTFLHDWVEKCSFTRADFPDDH